MKLAEAKNIVSAILEWQFVMMGVKSRNELNVPYIDLNQYSLIDLIKANKIVQGENNRLRALAQYHNNKGHKTKGVHISLNLADRLISAVYTALHFDPNGEIVVLINDLGVGVVKVEKYD